MLADNSSKKETRKCTINSSNEYKMEAKTIQGYIKIFNEIGNRCKRP